MQTITELEKRMSIDMLGRMAKEVSERLEAFKEYRLTAPEEIEALKAEQEAVRSLYEKFLGTPTYDEGGELQIVDLAEDVGLRRSLLNDLNKSIAPIGAKYGVTLRYNTMRYLNKGFQMKLECVVPVADTPEELVKGLRPGDQFKRRGTIFIVQSVEADKGRVIALTNRRKMYWVSFENLLGMIKIRPYNMGQAALRAMAEEAGRQVPEELDFSNLPLGPQSFGSLTVEPKKMVRLANGKLVNMNDIEEI